MRSRGDVGFFAAADFAAGFVAGLAGDDAAGFAVTVGVDGFETAEVAGTAASFAAGMLAGGAADNAAAVFDAEDSVGGGAATAENEVSVKAIAGRGVRDRMAGSCASPRRRVYFFTKDSGDASFLPFWFAFGIPASSSAVA